MSRGFRNSDETQALSDQAVADEIERIIERGHEEAPGAPPDGRCQDCGGQIGEERLAVVPSTVRCVRCQAAWEQGPGRR